MKNINLKRKIKTGFLITVCLFVFTGCDKSQPAQGANELHFDLTGISEVTIAYDEEPVTFFKTDKNELIIKEYMTKDKDRYYADVKHGNGRIHISEGGKPFLKRGFSRYVEVYFPEKYQGNLIVMTTNGDIDMSDTDLELSSLRVDSTAGVIRVDHADASVVHLSSTSGTLHLGNITGEQIKLETTGGDIVCEKLNGVVTYTSTSGDIKVQSAVGSGTYKANNSGSLKVDYSKVTGDLSFFNKNDNIEVTLPGDLDFEFDARTKNGTVSTSFQECLSMDGQHVYGTVGDTPDVKVKTETKNGNIKVTQ